MFAAEFEIGRRAAAEAGALLRDLRLGVTAREKGPADLVTAADLAAQQLIRQAIESVWPDDIFLAEEDDGRTAAASELPHWPRCWIVDPLDGTTNYVHGMDGFAISVAFACHGQVEVGIVYDPVRDEMYSTVRGQGAQLNGRPLRVSQTRALDQALVAASLPARVQPGSLEVQRLLEVLYRAQAVRRLGSAALNLCAVARGAMDAYWATSVKAWDVAAGVLMVTEAGGIVADIDGGTVDLRTPRLTAAATATLLDELQRTLRQAQSS